MMIRNYTLEQRPAILEFYFRSFCTIAIVQCENCPPSIAGWLPQGNQWCRFVSRFRDEDTLSNGSHGQGDSDDAEANVSELFNVTV